MGKASKERLEGLHGKLTAVFEEILACDADMIPSATLKTITAFVKDNNITCQLEESIGESLRDTLAKKRKLATVTNLPLVQEG